MSKDKGFIKLYRSFFDNKIWQAARAFSECEAWIDLIQSARFEASPTTSRIGGYEVTWGRGEYPASNRFLARKWGRSEQWVKTFLGKLKREGMITTNNLQGVNVITLVNFEKFNGEDGDVRTKDKADSLQSNPLKTLDNTKLQRLATHPNDPNGEISLEKQADSPHSNPLNNPLNALNDNELQLFVTQLVTQQVTHLMNMQPTPNPNTKKGEEKNSTKKKDNNKLLSKKETLLFSVSNSENDEYSRFCKWLLDNTPNCISGTYDIKPPNENEYIKLRSQLSQKELTEYILSIENNSDYLKKYKSMYLTIRNWSKRDGRFKT